jgi:NADH-quinone oxidoreductase subunit I
MYGTGIVKGLGVTLKHLIDTYVDDFKWGVKRYTTDAGFEASQSPETRGIITIQYPEVKMAVPERFRFIPFLVVNDDDHPEAPGAHWCTSCGICSKVCPPQCIWIVRTTDPKSGRPVPEPEQFYIDIDICMNCGYCAEFCPFDAIKMDHDYELSSYDRTTAHILDKARLSKPLSYWQTIAPSRAEEERQVREAKEAEKAARKGCRGKE